MLKAITAKEIVLKLSELLNLPPTDDFCRIKTNYLLETCLHVTALDYSTEEWEEMLVAKNKSVRDSLSILCAFLKISPGDYCVTNEEIQTAI